MPRPKKTIRTIFKTVGLPEDLVARLELDLFSELEGRVPLGAQQEFFTKLVREHYAQLDAQLIAARLLLSTFKESYHGE